MALLTRERLPDFPSFLLHVQVDRTSNALFFSLPRDLEIGLLRLDELTEFTLRIYKDIFNKTFEKNEPEMTYWLAPVLADWKSLTPDLTPERLIDWALLRNIYDNAEIPWSIDMPNDQLLNRYLIDRWDGGRRFFSLAIEPELRPSDPVPADVASHKYMNTILDYSISLFSKSRTRSTWRKDQPVIKAERILHRLNLLDEYSAKDKSVKTKSYLCPEPLKISAVSIQNAP